MRNLKRVLCLSLAVVMLLGMMVVGTSANNFTDSSEIVNTEAVDTMNALNIINGTPDGSFNPKGIVTRAEMCKMICVALNGGKDPQLGNNYTSFTDTKGNWAAGYIEYCYNLGIVSGRGEGIFDPTGTVTGSEAAKMLLVAIGYKAESEGFVGAGWEMAVNVIASQKDLYDELAGMGVSAGLSRDNAAQMVYNAINAIMVEYSYNLGSVDGDLTTIAVAKDVANASIDTLLEKKFDMKTTYGFMTGAITYTSTTEKYDYTLNTMTGDTLTSIKTKADYSDLYGQYVKVLWKNDSSKTIYGMYAEDSTVMASGYNGDIGAINASDVTLKIDDVAYKVENTTIPVKEAISGTLRGTISAITATAPYSLKLIDTDDNGKADVMIVTPFTVQKVNYVGASNITFSAAGSKKTADIVTYDGMVKGDYVVYTAAANVAIGKDTVAEVSIATGTITGVKATNTKFLVDGAWLTKGAGVTAGVLNDTIDYIAFGGIMYYAKVTESGTTSKDIAMVITAASTTDNIGATVINAKLLLADGTKKVVTVSKMNGATPDYATVVAPAVPATVATTDDVDVRIGGLVTYKVDSDSKYELTDISASNLAGYKGVGNTSSYASKLVGGYELADDAVVFMLTAGAASTPLGSNDGKVYTGKELKNTYTTTTPVALSVGFGPSSLYNTVSGFNYAEVAVLVGAPVINSASNYGFLVADAYESVEDGSTYRNFEIFDGTVDSQGNPVTLEVKEKASGLTGLVAGAVITYDVVSSTVIKNVSAASATTSVVTGWDDASKISIAGLGNSKVTSDTVVLYVDTKNNVGVAGGAIAIGDDVNGDDVADINNVYYIGTTTELDLLVVDVNNKIDGMAATLTVAAADTDGLGAVLATAKIYVANVAADNSAAIAAAFTNESAVSYTANAASCVVYAQDGTATTFTMTAFTALAGDSILIATYTTQVLAEGHITALATANGSTVAITYVDGGAVGFDADDSFTVIETAPNGEVLAGITYTMD